MKKLLLNVLLISLASLTFAQQPSVLYFDFESTENPVFSSAGGSFDGVVMNPAVDAVNGSDSVGSTLTGNNSWDGITFAFAAPLDLRTERKFSMMVYHPTDSGETRLQFGSNKLDVWYTTPGEWAELTWEIPEGHDNEFSSVLLCFAHEEGVADATWYFDELRGPPTHIALEPNSYYSTADNRKEWTGFENAGFGGVILNPDPDMVNDNPYAAKFITGTANWAGIAYDLVGPVDFSASQLFQMKVYHPDSTGNASIQLEGSGATTMKISVPYTTPGEWAYLSFNPDDATSGDTTQTYTKLVVILDDADADSGEVWLFDDIRGPVVDVGDAGPVRTYFDFDSIPPENDFSGFQGSVWGGVSINPLQDGVNGSDSVGLFYTGSANWSGIVYQLPGTIDFSDGYIFTMKVYSSDSVGNARVQLEGSGGKQCKISVPYTTPGAWQELEFDARNTVGSEPYDDFYPRITLIFDDKDSEIGEEWYFDDLMGPKLTPIYYVTATFEVASHIDGVKSYAVKVNNSGSLMPLYNDGTHGDVTAGDSLWTAEVQGVPVGDIVYDVYADSKMVDMGDNVAATIPSSLDPVMINFVAEMLASQESTLWFDFEDETPAFSSSGGSFEGAVENPVKDSVNGSMYVGTTLTGGNGWDGITYKFPAPLDLRNERTFSMMVYHPTDSGETRLQFGSIKLDTWYTTPGKWAKLTWEIPEGNDNVFTSVLLCFAHEEGVAGAMWYFDELKGAPSHVKLEPASYFSTENNRKDWIGFQGATYEGVVENPGEDMVNERLYAGKATTGTDSWSGIYIDLAGPIDFSSTQMFQMLVRSDSIGDVRLQLEGSTPKLIINATYDTPGEWAWLFFDPKDATEGDTSMDYNRVVVIFDDKDTDQGEEWYFDEIRGPVVEIGYVEPTHVYFDYDSITPPWFTFQGAVWGGVMPNPLADAVNGTDSVGVAYTGTDTWSGMAYDLPNTINFSDGFNFTMKVYNADSAGVVRLSLERPGKSERCYMYDTLTTAGEWVELSYDARLYAPENALDDFYTRVVLAFDYTDKDVGEEWYFDELKGPGFTPKYNNDAVFTVVDMPKTATSVEIDINNSGTMVTLYNDGTNGDATAGDSIWTAEVMGLPVGDHVMDVYVSGSKVIYGDDVAFSITASMAADMIEFIYNPTSIDELDDIGFVLYPNPADDQITIRLHAGIMSSVAVYNVVGSEIRRIESVNVSEYNLNISDLSSGIYFIRVTTTDGAGEVVKLIVK